MDRVHATIEDAIINGDDLSTNAFMLVNGWVAGPILLEFVAKFMGPLKEQSLTSEQLASKTGAEEGPLGILLRACHILGYISMDAQTRQYSLVDGQDLQELARLLHPESEIAVGFQDLYANVRPPFVFPSDDAEQYLAFWEEQRHNWSSSKNKGLVILMDGMVLAPLLASITYFARWDEEGQEHAREHSFDRFDFSKMDSQSQSILGDIFELLGVGTMNAKGIVLMSSKGTMALQRCYAYYVPISYAPLLAQMPEILFGEASWGFGDGGDAFELEEHIDRILNVVGSGAQHRTLFKDLMRHVETIFRGDKFDKQPQFIVDTGCGDGSLLIHIYEYVRTQTPRGRALADHPLTMVGVDLNEDPRVTTAVNLSKYNIPHLVIPGDVGKPADIVQSLKKKKVDPVKTLHVRSFLDHDRPYIAATSPLSSAAGLFAMEQLSDFVHLDKKGNTISNTDVFASLVQHFERWAAVLDVGFGLLVLEVMMLDVSTTRRFFNDNVSFPLDLVQSLSRQYLVSAAAFAMAAAMSGLLPSDYKHVDTYPEQGHYHRMLSQHLVKKPFRVRFAEPSDLPRLLALEAVAWAEPLRATGEVLSKRVATSPTTVLVAEISGEIAAVLYMQRIDSISILPGSKFMSISELHSPKGQFLQLIAIASDPKRASMNLGDELKEFALHLARLDASIGSVVGVTRCGKEYSQMGGGDMQRYVDQHFSGTRTDSTLAFHSFAGAGFVSIIDDYRPEDTQNEGKGVLIQYKINRSGMRQGGANATPTSITNKPALDLLKGIMTELGYPADLGDTTKSFFDYGMDSLELVRIRNKVSGLLDLDLPATLLLDFPTVHDLAAQLDRDRRSAKKAAGIEDDAKPPPRRRKAEEEVPRQREATVGDTPGVPPPQPVVSWDTIGPEELLDIQKRCNDVFALRSYQARFTNLAKQCFPDMIKYVICVEEIMMEVEGPVFLEYGLLDKVDYHAVQQCREKMTGALVRHWTRVTDLRSGMQKMLHLTLQDQNWGSSQNVLEAQLY